MEFKNVEERLLVPNRGEECCYNNENTETRGVSLKKLVKVFNPSSVYVYVIEYRYRGGGYYIKAPPPP